MGMIYRIFTNYTKMFSVQTDRDTDKYPSQAGLRTSHYFRI